MNNLERRDAQMAYISDESVMEEQKVCRRILQELNTVDRSDFEKIGALVKQLFGKSDGAFLNPPFYCDYGYNIEIGENFFMNMGCVILDGARVTFGDNVFIAPGCGFYTAGHPLDHKRRNKGLEYALPITVGNNVWIGAQVCVLPGVSIGDNTVIGAGSVVTRDVPAGVLAAGNPCRVIRPITEADAARYRI